MSCCGNKRRKLRQATSSNRVSVNSSRNSIEATTNDNTAINFQYIGKSKLRVIGPRTRNLYRFNQPGALVAVDPRDQFALIHVPTLRKVAYITENNSKNQ